MSLYLIISNFLECSIRFDHMITLHMCLPIEGFQRLADLHGQDPPVPDRRPERQGRAYGLQDRRQPSPRLCRRRFPLPHRRHGEGTVFHRGHGEGTVFHTWHGEGTVTHIGHVKGTVLNRGHGEGTVFHRVHVEVTVLH